MRRSWLLFALSFLLALPMSAASLLESVDGDISDDPAAPTLLILDAGANQVAGVTSIPAGLDFLRIRVPAGHALTSVVPTAFAGSDVSFLGVEAGASWTAGTFFSIDPAVLLGWAHFGPGDIGTDILPAIGTGTGAQGFVPPLGAGDYTVLFQETGVVDVSYALELTVSSVAEPAALAALALAILPFARRRNA